MRTLYYEGAYRIVQLDYADVQYCDVCGTYAFIEGIMVNGYNVKRCPECACNETASLELKYEPAFRRCTEWYKSYKRQMKLREIRRLKEIQDE